MTTATTPLPPMITLCGSMRFFDRMLAVAAAETAAGRIVLAPFCVVTPSEQDNDLKAMLDELHRHKIDLADEVVIVTDDTGYIGDSTRAEISYAEALGKPTRIVALASK
ncbi:hypothetical protein [Nocardia wallacei]|uniref:hypothetical protein n=1 Tax=Nocardia wallacei TaxID=480035 RepID=UPI0024546F44|nr:hypothetical protein [Nocardia wallacei]